MLFFISLWTGAGSGLGRMLSEKLALRHGAKVVCVDVNAEGNAETVNNINREKVRMSRGERERMSDGKERGRPPSRKGNISAFIRVKKLTQSMKKQHLEDKHHEK